ncbi:MAG: hypothetical protein U5N27_05710 [Rhizobium sp.]|nr:hypothetical protein [Rhizobium sp.]
MKYYFDKLAVLIRDHSFAMAFVALAISLIGGAYSIGLKLGENRKVFLEDRLLSLQEQVDKFEKRNNELKSDIDSLSEINSSLQSQLEYLKNSNGNLESEVEKFQEEISIANEKNFTLSSNIQTIKNDIARKDKEINKINADFTRLHGENKDLISSNEILTAENERNYSEYQSALKTKEELESKLSEQNEITHMAIGDALASFAGDRGWTTFYQLKLTINDLKFGSINGISYSIQTHELKYNTKGIRERKPDSLLIKTQSKAEEIPFNTPILMNFERRLCYRIYRLLNSENYRMATLCRIPNNTTINSIGPP